MTTRDLERFKGSMHHLVSVTANDGRVIRGHIQPWNAEDRDPAVYFTPEDYLHGQSVRLLASEIRSVEVLG